MNGDPLDTLERLFEGRATERTARANPPGRSELSFRFANFESWRRLMLTSLGLVEVTSDSTGASIRPLADANLDPQTDWMIALIDGWAIIGDILTFYQERIINEGYLGTAREQRSLELLTQTLGVCRGCSDGLSDEPSKQPSPTLPPATIEVVRRGPSLPSSSGPAGPVIPTPGASTATPLPATKQPKQPYDFRVDPGAAAITDVLFRVVPHRATGGRVTIRAGTAIRSHRVDGSMPIVFETSRDLEARLEYNALAPVRASAQTRPSLTAASIGLRLSGTATGLRAGSSILVIGELSDAPGQRAWLYGPVISVEPNLALDFTLITWTPPCSDGSGGLNNQSMLGARSLESLQVFAFSRTRAPFGHDARSLADAPLATQIELARSGGVARWDPSTPGWTRLNDGLPTRSLSALAIGLDGTAWIAGAFGVAYHDDALGTWTTSNSGLGSAEVSSLAVATDGSLWAATSLGQVFRTLGRGHGWSAISGGYIMVATAAGTAPVKTNLPRTAIASVQPYIPSPSTTSTTSTDPPPPPPAVLVGTGLGVFGNALDSRGWLTDNFGLGATGGSPYLSSPLVDLRVLDPSFEFDYAIAATTGEIVAFAWHPFDAPYVPGSPAPNNLRDGVEPTVSPASLPALGSHALAGVVELAMLTLTDGTPGLLALTDAGPWRWDPSSSAFVAIPTGLDPAHSLQTIAASPSAASIAFGNDGYGVWSLSPDWVWQAVEGLPGLIEGATPTSNPAVASLIAASGSQLLASTPLTFAEQWPNYTVVQSDPTSTWIDVDSKPFDLAPGSWVVIASAEQVAVYGVIESAVAYRSTDAYDQPGRVFRIVVEVQSELQPAPSTIGFDPRDADVFARSVALAVYEPVTLDDRPIGGSQIELAGIIDGLDEPSTARLLAFSGPRPRLCVTMAGGLWNSATLEPGGWVEQGFGFRTITALCPWAGELWVGTSESGVFVRSATGNWEDRSQGLASASGMPGIVALAASDAQIVVATAEGAAVWDPSVATWVAIATLTDTQPLALLAGASSDKWWVGTAESGLLQASGQLSATTAFVLEPNTEPLLSVELTALVEVAGLLVIGTSKGVYRHGSASPIAPMAVTALAAAGSAVLVGTAGQGAWRIDDVSVERPSYGPTSLPSRAVNVLASDSQSWYAGTQGAGVYAAPIGPEPLTWSWLPIGAADDVLALALAPTEPEAAPSLFAGAAGSVRLISTSGVAIGELVYTNALVLPADFASELSQALVTTRLRSAFAKANLTLPADAIVTALPALPVGRWLLSSSGDASAPLYILFSDVLRGIVVIEPNTVPTVIGSPGPIDESSGLRRFELADGELHGNLLLADAQSIYRPPTSDDASVSEVQTLVRVDYDYSNNATTIELEAPLANLYARASLQISANVVRASQGETVSNEILGDGESGTPNQRFTLRRAPLTFLPAPPPTYRLSTLSVVVDRVSWREIGDLQRAGPSDRVYSVSVDHEGRATVGFGDGTHGARLPTGSQNVIATYRVGLGTQGDVTAGSLDVMLSPPPGVASVTNPIPATSGVAPDDGEAVRAALPLTARTRDRVVSLVDHADLATSYPGVRQATAIDLRVGKRRLVQITVVFDAHVPSSEYGSRCAALASAIADAQVQPAPSVSVATPLCGYFELKARIRAAADLDPAQLAVDVFEALYARWSGERANLAESVRPNAIEAVIQAVPGVEGVRVSSLTRTDDSHDSRTVLIAAPAHYDRETQQVVAATLLQLDPSERINRAPSTIPAGVSVFIEGGVTLQISSPNRETDR